MNARILPVEEWDRLEGGEAGDARHAFNPDETQVIVVEDGDRIVGTWAVMRVVHVECLWVAPEHRGAFGVAKRLLKAMRDVAGAWGARYVLTGSISPHVTDLIRRFGGIPAPYETFILPLEMSSVRRREARSIGRTFHEQLASQVEEVQHPDSAEHDEQVGRALRTAIEGDPKRAERQYNAWAGKAGYEPVKFLGRVDGRLRADIRTATVDVDDEYRVSVVKEEACPLPQ